MQIEYKYEPSHIAYMKEQVWEAREDLTIYGKLTEFEQAQIGPHLPDSPGLVMDLGCGLGRGAIALNQHYGNPKIRWILADRTGDTVNTGVFNPLNEEVYNNLELTESFCKLNGLKKFKTFDTASGDWSKLKNVDLIVSRAAIGFHVPIERFIDQLINITSPGGTMIFSFMAGRPAYNETSFADRFMTPPVVLRPEYEAPFPHQHWLILRNPKK